jgi:ketosteroid isomerase-like protein
VTTRDPKLTVLMFNECINNQDIGGLSALMTDDHTFVDRENTVEKGKDTMTQAWLRFFAQFPEYRNTFTRLESRDDLVIVTGYANWVKGGPADHVIWTARIRSDRVAEWRIYEDTQENKAALLVDD